MEIDDPAIQTQPLERTTSQQSATSTASRRSATLRARNINTYKRNSTASSVLGVGGGRHAFSTSQHPPSSSASSIAASDKSLTSFPSFSPESPGADRFVAEPTPRGKAAPNRREDEDDDDEERVKTARPSDAVGDTAVRERRVGSLVDDLIAQTSSFSRKAPRDALFQDAPLPRSIPGALHTADNDHIERLLQRHGAVNLVRQVARDLAEREAQITQLRRRADARERALRKILRECGLSNLDVETRLRTVEAEMAPRLGEGMTGSNSALTDMMSDAMADSMTGEHNLVARGETIRASSQSASSGGASRKDTSTGGEGTMRGWKAYLLGSGSTIKSSRSSSVNAAKSSEPSLATRSQPSLERRPTLQEDLFTPPDPARSGRASSRASSLYSGGGQERKGSGSASLASMALRLVSGASTSSVSKDAEPRGRAESEAGVADYSRSVRAASAASNRTARSGRAVSVAGGPKALMAMRRTTPAPHPITPSAEAAGGPRSHAQELWGTMLGSSPQRLDERQESHGPVEMDAILPPESQPPTLSHIYNNFANSEYLTDRFGFIYDQRRKKRQREAAQITKHIRNGSRTEMLANGRAGVSRSPLEEDPDSTRGNVMSQERPESANSQEDGYRAATEEGKPKRWQDYLKIATFPTELLSHTPSMAPSTLEVLEAPSMSSGTASPNHNTSNKPPSITPTGSGLVPLASTTTALDTNNDTRLRPEADAIPPTNGPVSDDTEPVKILLQQLSEVHDALQSEKTVRWNEFLRKVRAERRREGQAAVAAAAAAAEARYERPAVIMPETRIADGEMIGISGLGNKGKVGRAKWNEFKALVLGGIPVVHRAKIWAECSGAAALRVPGYYEDLVAQSEQGFGDEDDASVVSQIQMDIHRTLPDNIFFRKGPGVSKLREVLLAYARRNKEVGYCQGMNLIAANLLLILPSAEDAFWILASIVENILPQGYYDDSLIASRADQQVLRQYVATVLPKLSAHLEDLSIELEALTFQWFLSVFTDCLSAEALFRVWDVVLCSSTPNEGSTFLFQVALALLKLNETNLLQCRTAAGVYTYINHHMTEHAISIDGLIQASEALRRVVPREEVEERRRKIMDAERDVSSATGGYGSQAKGDDDDDVGRSRAGSLAIAEPRPMVS